MPNVVKVQAGYKVQPLSQYLGQPAPPPAPAIDWPAFTKEDMKQPFAGYLNFILQFCPPVEEEKPLRAKFATIGIEAGKPFDFDKLSDAHKAEYLLAIKEGYDAIDHEATRLRQSHQRVGHRVASRRSGVFPRRLGASRRRRVGGDLRQ